jgi:TonB family protein
MVGTGATVAATFMSMTKLQLGIAGVLALAGATSFLMQVETRTALQSEITRLHQQNQGIAALQAENIRLTKVAVEVEALRRDDVALGQLRDEAAALKQRLQRASVTAPAKPDDGGAPGFVGEVYDLSLLDQPPKPTSRADPLIPPEMLKAKIPGKVMVEFVVDAKGAVHDVHALSSTHSVYEASALEAVSQWQYEPGEKNGRAVNARVKVPIVFTFAKYEDQPGESSPPAANGKKPDQFTPWF